MSSKSSVAGYAAGIAAGVSYGFNPLFAKYLITENIPVYTILLYRYAIAAVLMLALMLICKESPRVRKDQLPLLLLLGIIFAGSSIGLFEAYNYIPSGLATTIIYLYPVFTALIMLFLHKSPTPKTWVAIGVTLAGVILICLPSGGVVLKIAGLVLSVMSALCYALYLVIVNNSRHISDVSAHTITLYGLATGAVLFTAISVINGYPIVGVFHTGVEWGCILGLAIIPTLISMLALAIATRSIGPSKTAVLGVFEPLTAILIGLLAFGEKLTPSIICGIVLCIAAITFMATDR